MSASITSPSAPSSSTEGAAPEPSGRRRHAVKAVAAGALAVVLLTAGGGTFSHWYEEQHPVTGALTAGHLSMDTLASTWTDQNGNTIDLATYRMVPGDTVTMTATTHINAVGDNLRAELAVDYSQTDFATYANMPDSGVTVTTSVAGLTDTDGSDGYSVVGKKGTTANDDGRSATVTFTIAWSKNRADGSAWGSGPTSGEDASGSLNAVRVVLSQK
ncbi:alternate-type signal peptide domain-containing protein [Tersicoccus sp. MR15.9]|uniref:alternate-type signal peptide domain-containing protein n=1 Tax=Tersicoccus mangrovi TaxID=3121635 RepID=UPI002FE6B058